MASPAESETVLKQLMKKREEIESNIKELHEVLNSQKGVGMDGPLVDAEQFPRNDIDIPTVRHARQQIICLQNDYKSLMKTIEEELHRLHNQIRSSQSEEAMDVLEPKSDAGQEKTQVPFARVDRVDVGSPAEKAGLEVGDEIIQFGSINESNFEKLNQIGEIVQHSINRNVSVIVLRNGEQRRVSLKPNTWSGRGLLGCIIVPLKR